TALRPWALPGYGLAAVLGRGVSQRHGAVEHEPGGGRVLRVDGEVPEALELIALAGNGRGQARLEPAALEPLERSRVEIRFPVAVLGIAARARNAEEMIVEPHLGLDRVRGRHPVDGPLHPAPVRRVAASRRRIVDAAHFDYLSRSLVLDRVHAAHEIRVAQAHLVARKEPEVLLRRILP